MTLTEASEIVLCLATENIISEREAQEDPEVLVPERERQIKALEMIHEFHRIAFEERGLADVPFKS